jgi:hypothetical protein
VEIPSFAGCVRISRTYTVQRRSERRRVSRSRPRYPDVMHSGRCRFVLGGLICAVLQCAVRPLNREDQSGRDGADGTNSVGTLRGSTRWRLWSGLRDEGWSPPRACEERRVRSSRKSSLICASCELRAASCELQADERKVESRRSICAKIATTPEVLRRLCERIRH